MHPAIATSLYVLIVAAATTTFSGSALSISHALQTHPPPLALNATAGGCLPRERDALLAFKQGLTADPAGLLSTWQRGDDCCVWWKGVECASRTGPVIALMLQNPYSSHDEEERKDFALTGRISRSLFALRHLSELDLSYNHLQGPVPPEIGMLPNLTSLDLSFNNLDGVITEQHFARLESLKYIDFTGNSFEFRISRGWQPPFRLELASFRSCRMGPRFPAWLQSQSAIRVLDMSDTSLAGRLPDWFATVFSMANSLQFYNNEITGELPRNMNIMSVELFFFGSNKLTGQIPQLPASLTVLDVANNNLSGPLPLDLGAPNLEQLVLFSNHITGHIPESVICKWQALNVLDLSNNHFEGGFPRCFNASVMQNIFISNNRFSGKFPSFLQGCKMLSILDLGHNNFYGTLPTWIGDLVGLQLMRLSHNNFSGSIPVEITNLVELFHLDLANNSLSGALPWNFSRMRETSEPDILSLIVSRAPSEIYNISVVSKRKELFYHGSGVSFFISIDLSSNHITGEIPRDISSLHALVSLNLSKNCLSGKIPHNIGEMRSLQSIDLSRNMLSGEIPSSLANLTFLASLDLSSNNLTGTIPSGSQLDTLYSENPDMYSENGGLCGHPLLKNCSSYHVVPQDHPRTTASLSKMEPFHIGLALGFIAGTWLVFCTLLFKKGWRIAYFRLFDNLYDKTYVFVVVGWAKLTRNTSAN